jgi:transmembrane sensor
MMRRDESSEIEAAAARWVVRLRDEPSKQTEIELDRWLAQSAEHRGAYMRCEVALAMTRELADDPAFKDDLEVVARIAAKEAQEREAQRRRFGSAKPLWIGLAAAAALAAIVIATVFVGRAPDIQEYVTAVGEQRTVTLADRSVLTLNTDTALSVRLSDKERRIDLHRGEAFFSVSHDPSRAFEVWAAGGKVRAVGTQFGVVVQRDAVTVSVLEGAVVVSTGAGGSETPRVAANESVRYAGNRIGAVETTDLRRINAWREGKVEFDDVSLADAIADFNRYTDRKVVLGSAEIGGQQVTGSLRIGDGESLEFLLRESLGLRIVERNGTMLVLPAEETGTNK